MKKILAILFAACLICLAATAVSAAYEELTPYDIPSNGVHFAFDGNYATDNQELVGIPKGSIDFTEDREGKAKSAIYLDSDDDFIELLKDNYDGNWTVSAWLRTDEAVDWIFLMHSMYGSVRPVTNDNVMGEAGVSMHSSWPGIGPDFKFQYGLELGEWQMFTVTNDRENNVISLYIDNELMQTVEISMMLPMTLIGGDCPELHGWQRAAYMAVDDLWLFGRALSEEEIDTLFKTGSVPAVDEGYGKIDAADLDARRAAELETQRNPLGLEHYDIPAEGVHFSFDGTYATDNSELTGEPFGSIVSVADRNGKSDGAVSFDTADDYVLLNKADYWGDWSASAWVKFDGQFPNYSFLTQSCVHYSLRPAHNGGEGYVGLGAHTGDVQTEAQLTLDKWQMLTYTYSPETNLVTVYIDGVPVTTVEKEEPLALQFIGNDAPADAGGKGWAIDQYMCVDDLWLFGKTLNDAEVAALYADNSLDAAVAAALEAQRNPLGLEHYDIPAEGVHFSFDGTYATDNGELAGTPAGSIVSVEDRNGKADGAVKFDTADDYVLLNKADYWGDWSASAWIKFDGQFPNYSFLTQSCVHYSLRPAHNGGAGFVGLGAYTGDVQTEAQLTLDTWQMLTYTYDVDTNLVTVYLDGEKVTSVEKEEPLALQFIGNDAPADAGGKGWAIDQYMNVDDLWLYGKTLTADEVAALYASSKAEEAAPVVEEPEPVVEEPETTAEPEPVAEPPKAEDKPAEEKSPNTADAGLLFVCVLAASSAMAVALRKRKA